MQIEWTAIQNDNTPILTDGLMYLMSLSTLAASNGENWREARSTAAKSLIERDKSYDHTTQGKTYAGKMFTSQNKTTPRWYQLST